MVPVFASAVRSRSSAARPWLNDDEKVRSLSGNLEAGAGAAILGSVSAGGAADGFGAEFDEARLPLSVAAGEGWASWSPSCSRRSASRRPLEVTNSYPERGPTGSAYHAATFVLTRTSDPPDAVDLTWTVDW